MTQFQQLSLRTGISLNVALAGDQRNPTVVLLHGFPESHRTWRDIVPWLEERLFLVMPDQRGFAGSDLPQNVDAYRTDILIDDLFALVDSLGLEQFSLVGHDWGGAIAWGAALRRDPRLKRLAIINAPHPFIFQKSLFENEEQRAASQYISTFRSPGFEGFVEAKGFDWFFNTTFSSHTDVKNIPETERRQYIADWSQEGAFSAMLNWYRAARVIVPAPNEDAQLPRLLSRAYPNVKIPTLVIWGMEDVALLPVQLAELDQLVDDLAIIRLQGVGHFAPWEAPEDVVHALEPFLAGRLTASAEAK